MRTLEYVRQLKQLFFFVLFLLCFFTALCIIGLFSLSLPLAFIVAIGTAFLVNIFFIWWLSRRSLGKFTACVQALEKENASLRASLIEADKLASVGRLASGIVHDLNNPLMLIRENAGWIHDLMEDGTNKVCPAYEQIIKATQAIEKHVDRAGGITKNILGVLHRSAESFESTSLQVLIDETIVFLSSKAKDAQVTFQCTYIDSNPLVVTNAAKLQQIMLNILDNAIDAIGNKGEVHIQTTIEKSTVCIEITDSGSGVPKEQVAKLFEAFYTSKEKGKGTGLGLYICHSLAKELGGAISAKNSKAGGLTVRILLPM